MSKHRSYGPKVESRTRQLLESILRYVAGEIELESRHSLKFDWKNGDSSRPKLLIETTRHVLEVVSSQNSQLPSLSSTQVRDSLTVLEDFVEILEDYRTQKRGSSKRHFTLELWSLEIGENLEKFSMAWTEKRAKKLSTHHFSSEQSEDRKTTENDRRMREDFANDFGKMPFTGENAASSNGVAKKVSQPEDLTNSILEIVDDIEKYSLGKEISGVATNFYDLDAMTQGFQRSDVILLAGRMSMGKTSFALNMARNISALHSLPVFIFSSETNRKSIIYQMLSTECSIEANRLKSGRIRQKEWEVLGHAINQLSQFSIYIDDSPTLKISDISAKLSDFREDSANNLLGAIFIDNLQMIEGNIRDTARSLKRIAAENNVPVIVISQVSEGLEHRTFKRPRNSDIREGNAVLEMADVVIMLYRDEYYNPDSVDRGITEIIITKHRRGPVGTIKLLFEPQFTRFRNLVPPPPR